MPSTSLRLWLGAAGLTAVCFSGCATLHLPWDKTRIPQATAQNPAVRIVCLWEQAEGRDPDGLPCRGFAGQILFLSNRNAMPVQVPGNVRIYLFDDVGTAEDQSKPLRQFDFSSEAWQVHLTKSAIGPSYSVFVPYVRRGQHNAQCSIRVRLTPQEGPTIFSEVCSLPLRGPASSSETTMISEPIFPADQVQSQVNSAMTQVLHKTTTIPLAHRNSGALALADNSQEKTARANAKTTPRQPPVEDRLARMEHLLEQAIAERKAAAPEIDVGSIQPAGHESPASDDDPPRRFKLDQRSE